MTLEVQGPVLLARPLPQPAQSNGVRQFTTVQSLRAGQKRKRREICLATDGDSVTIYEAQNGQTVTSYTVPPTSSFCCKPCSVRISGVQGRPPTRVTYCAIKEEKIKIQSFTELSQPSQLQEAITRNGKPIDGSDPIVYLDILPGAEQALEGSTGLELVSVQQGGLVCVLSGDLQEKRWEAQLEQASGSKKIQVLCAQATSAQEVSTSILKQRMDIFGTINHRASLLAVVFIDHSDLSDRDPGAKFGLWLIGPTRSKTTQKKTVIQPLLLHELPMSEKWNAENKARLEFPIRPSKLFVGFTTGAINYDLTTLSPRIMSEISVEGSVEGKPQDLISTIPLSSSLLAGATFDNFRIYDSKYQTVQSSVDLGGNAKQKRKMGGRGNPVHFISYFAQLGRVLAIRRNDLIAFDLRTTRDERGRRPADKPPRLADCLGRGISTKVTTLGKPKQNRNLAFGTITWTSLRDSIFSDDIRTTLDRMAQEGNSTDFDDLAMNEIQNSRIFSDDSLKGNDADGLLAFGSLNDVDVGYLVSKVFQLSAFQATSPDTRLEVALPTPRLISWMSSQGFLTRHTLERHLTISSNASKEPKIRPGSVTEALATCDESFTLLESHLQGCGFSDISEIIEAIEVLLTEVVEQTETLPDSGAAIINGINQMEVDESEEEDNQSKPIDRAAPYPTQNNSGFLARGTRDTPARRSLVLAISCLAGYGLSVISSKLGSTFNPSEILSLIQFLRQELFYGGYTSSSQGKADPATSEHQLSLNSIVKILSGCIDALGPVALFTQGDRDGFIESMIPDLRSEIARATEAVAEATRLQGILRETLRYADSASQLRGPDGPVPLIEDNIVSSQKPGTIITLYSEPQMEAGDIAATGSMLPLSLRADEVVSKTKMRKGGGQVTERSAREMHMLQARAKGRYTFERLVL